MEKSNHPLEILHQEFLHIADAKERDFIEASDELPQMAFSAERLSLRYVIHEMLSGEVIAGEQEDYLYPHQGIAAALLNSVHPDQRDMLMEGTMHGERQWNDPSSEVKSRFMEGALRPDDFLLLNATRDCEADDPEGGTPTDPADPALAHAILQAIRERDASDEAALLLKYYDKQATMVFWPDFFRCDEPHVEFWVRRDTTTKLTHSTHFQWCGFGKNIENHTFEETINNLQQEIREQIIPYLQRSEERAMEGYKKKNGLQYLKKRKKSFEALLRNIRLGNLPFNEY